MLVRVYDFVTFLYKLGKETIKDFWFELFLSGCGCIGVLVSLNIHATDMFHRFIVTFSFWLFGVVLGTLFLGLALSLRPKIIKLQSRWQKHIEEQDLRREEAKIKTLKREKVSGSLSVAELQHHEGNLSLLRDALGNRSKK